MRDWYTDTTKGLVNERADKVDFGRLLSLYKNDGGAWCDGVGGHLLWTAHTSSF